MRDRVIHIDINEFKCIIQNPDINKGLYDLLEKYVTVNLNISDEEFDSLYEDQDFIPFLLNGQGKLINADKKGFNQSESFNWLSRPYDIYILGNGEKCEEIRQKKGICVYSKANCKVDYLDFFQKKEIVVGEIYDQDEKKGWQIVLEKVEAPVNSLVINDPYLIHYLIKPGRGISNTASFIKGVFKNHEVEHLQISIFMSGKKALPENCNEPKNTINKIGNKLKGILIEDFPNSRIDLELIYYPNLPPIHRRFAFTNYLYFESERGFHEYNENNFEAEYDNNLSISGLKQMFEQETMKFLHNKIEELKDIREFTKAYLKYENKNTNVQIFGDFKNRLLYY